jgi:Carboxypeptidase regulatory-like domain
MKNVPFLGIACLAGLLLMLMPTGVSAQTGSIAGVVKDTTGAVLPGVTVEATSPALIEKVRTVVTDGEGLYKILDLRPGTYAVTFTIPGFSSVRRDGIELSAGFTASVNAELRVGAVAETITVSGAAPLVDIQNTRQQTVVNREVIDSIPTGRNPASYAALVPGVIAAGSSGLTGQDVGGSTSDRTVFLIVHGSRGQASPLLYDGMRYNNMNGTPGGGHVIWAMNNAAVQEFTVEVGALSIQADSAGVWNNAIPKQGGNEFHGLVFANFTNDSLQSTGNVSTPAQATTLPRNWDFNPAIGGPLRKDKLWFFGAYRNWGIHEHPPGAFNDTIPFDFAYTPDLSRPAVNETTNQSFDLRMTWQAAAKHKISIWADENPRCFCKWRLASTTSPEATVLNHTDPNFLTQVTWNAPLTNKLLIDAGWTYHAESWGFWPQPYLPWGTYGVTELSTGVNFRAPAAAHRQDRSIQTNGKFIVSYVTGSHALRFGFQDMWGHRQLDQWVLGTPFSINLLNGATSSLTQFTYPYATLANVKWYMGSFVQDQWTVNRMTLNLGLRFDALNAYVPAQTYPATPIVDARSFAAIENAPNWKDVNPRLGIAYDLFGNGRTALKANLGRYIEAVTTGYSDIINPIVSAVNSATRTFRDTNGDFFPDCDLRSVAPNGECGALSNVNFGRGILTNAFDPAVLNGWRKRPFDWEIQAGIQHELRPGMSVNATYIRHWWGNFLVTDNLAVSPSDYSQFCITAPPDSRLPGGGGNQICGFYDVNPDKFGQVNNLITFAKNYGKQTDVYNGLDVATNVRLPRGILLQGGFNVGREAINNCDVVGKVDNPGGAFIDVNRASAAGNAAPLITNVTANPSPSLLYCDNAAPFQTQVKLLGSYPLPFGFAASAAFQSIPGAQIGATFVVPNAQIVPTLGRNLAAGPNAAYTAQIVAPGLLYNERLNQLDARLTRTFSVGATRRLQGQLDFYNLFNAGPALNQNNTYGAQWLRPTVIPVGRMVKIGGQFDF